MFLSIYCRQFSLTLNYPTLRSPVWRYRIGDSGIQYPARLDGDLFCFGKGNVERSKLLEAWMRMRYLVFFSDFTPYLQRNAWRSQELNKNWRKIAQGSCGSLHFRQHLLIQGFGEKSRFSRNGAGMGCSSTWPVEGLVGDKIHIALKGLAEGGTSFFPDRPSPKSTRRAEVSADIAKVALPAAGKAAVLLLQR